MTKDNLHPRLDYQDEDCALLNIRQAAKLLGLSTNYLYKLVQDKKIEHYRLGKYIRFTKNQLLLWVDEQKKTVKTNLPGLTSPCRTTKDD